MKTIYSTIVASLLLFGSAVYAEELMANLPPDPGAAGKATLEGIDSDNDGVRDDVQRWIVMSYPNSQKTREALRQLTVAQQRFILDAADPAKSLSNAIERGKAMDCLFYVDSSIAYSVVQEFKAATLNTYIRSKAYLQADHHLSGHVFSPSESFRQGCSFNPDVMPN
jgi:hypothetical protein